METPRSNPRTRDDTGRDGSDTVSQDRILLPHGGGGQLTDELLARCVLPRIGNEVLNRMLDSALLPQPVSRGALALTIDGYVASPWRFPGGDIGRLAVCGTVNDLAVCGAEPLGLALGLILAEGFETSDLEGLLDSVSAAAREANVKVVTGDTKVVGRDQADGVYITTAGVGVTPEGRALSAERVEPGDVLILSGPVGEHGLALMLAREMPELETPLRSDVTPLNGMIAEVLERAAPEVVFMRDPTRSGLAGLAADLARDSGRRITLEEACIPVRPEARRAADLLGLDPLEIANEGKLVAVVRPEAADEVLSALRNHEAGRKARVIGSVGDERDGLCELRTRIGGSRVLQKPHGELLARIC